MENLIFKTESAYSYPLLIKNLMFAPVVDNPSQEIVYRGTLRFTYRQFKERVRPGSPRLLEKSGSDRAIRWP